MAIPLILDDSRAYLAGPVAEADTHSADRAVGQLRADYERWARLGLGLLGFTGAILGAFFGVGLIGAMLEPGPPVGVIDIVILVVAWAITLASAVLLVRLWQSGRALTRAAKQWMRAPYILGGRQRTGAGWVTARTINLEPRILVRNITATLAVLLSLFGIAPAIRDMVEGNFDGFSASMLVAGFIALACGIGQMGGVITLVSGASEADPLWVRIRSSLAKD
ncbi:hypothetical protein [Microbacterium sp. C7(2022)]|uniref:hypothetical protein n=1 Tax=Microbacterium sp. C7(2022) TaxID=2992759 RepID=UPI00237B5FAC|nr:hypothetical protein [Microbacterium sp. C7(2022)]MDE0547487.1 hypothetical protein [Microbacterium sp. C7(2022)]